MKKLAIVMTFVFGAALVAPAFAADPVKKSEPKTECTKDSKACAKDGKSCCKAGASDKKDGKACCSKPATEKK
ncbi:MAG: hypothetical protein LWW85_02190 [Marinilabiliales bacterium]|nr:hypothetical protein [Marinilabiliales bacterium]